MKKFRKWIIHKLGGYTYDDLPHVATDLEVFPVLKTEAMEPKELNFIGPAYSNKELKDCPELAEEAKRATRNELLAYLKNFIVYDSQEDYFDKYSTRYSAKITILLPKKETEVEEKLKKDAENYLKASITKYE